MDNLNLKNIQLAYGAVYDQVLCESMEDLGFFDEVDEGIYEQEPLNELSVALIRRAAAKSANKVDTLDAAARKARSELSPSARFRQELVNRATRQHKKFVKAAYPGRRRKKVEKVEEEYDLYDLVLEYLLDEGYTDSFESAEAIMANMSNDWIEYIVEERSKGYGNEAIDRDAKKGGLTAQTPVTFGKYLQDNPPKGDGGPSRYILDKMSGKHSPNPLLIGASRSNKPTSASPVRRETNTDIEASMPKSSVRRRIRLSRRGR